MICNKCKGKKIKSRKNYFHGNKSKATYIFTCKDCGSGDIKKETLNRRFKKR